MPRISKSQNPIALHRLKLGITQQSLADAVGVNIRQIQKYEGSEAKRENMSLKVAAALSKAFNVPIEALLQ